MMRPSRSMAAVAQWVSLIPRTIIPRALYRLPLDGYSSPRGSPGEGVETGSGRRGRRLEQEGEALVVAPHAEREWLVERGVEERPPGSFEREHGPAVDLDQHVA